MTDIQLVLFDLDGTLLDTAHDMGFALNQIRQKYGLPALPLAEIRPAVGQGIKGLLKLGLDIHEEQANFNDLLNECLDEYALHVTKTTHLFPTMDNVLTHLESRHIPWGIVTNKPQRFTQPILKNLQLDQRASCIISGDTLPTRKPDPAQILHACKLLKQPTAAVLFVGDSNVDVLASKAAGTTSLVALYGYIDKKEDPFLWNADGYIHSPDEIIGWLEQPMQNG